MNYNKLSLKSKKMLYDVLKSENPVEMLEKRFKDISLKEEMELRSIIKELRKFGYINVNWADDIPYYITINNAAINYKEKLQENKEVENLENLKLANNSKIFISHRTSDKNIADALLDFFVATGISREKVFCSSLPGNDVKENIPMEIKEAIKNSCLNIAILSNEYYESAYCLNEAGILWFQDVTVIPIALPEIKPENMIGFLNSGYKIRRLDNSDDIAYIYDIVCEKSDSHQSKTSVVNVESRKLIDKYKEIISYRPQIQKHEINKQFEITTDDERIVLYYLLLNQVRKVAKNKMINWLQDDEVYGVDVSNAFDLLSSLGNSRFDNETLELSIDVFREYSRNSSEIINDLRLTVDEHIELASKKFKKMWDEKVLMTI